jgi:septal ring factor EnvC (AmiA/AmiB activator)
MLTALQSQQNLRLDVLERYVSDIKSQNEVTHMKHGDIEKSIEFVNSKLDDVQLIIKKLEEQRKLFSSQITAIEDKCEAMERLFRKTSIQIRNVPKQKAEAKAQLFEMVRKLSTTLGIKIEDCDLRDVYRTPSKGEKNTSAIVAEFSSTIFKGNYLTAVRAHKLNSIRYKTEQLNTAHLGLDGQKAEIYISEHLTPRAARLYFLARELRKSMDYEYCWTSNGLVYLRKTQGEPYIVIKNETQLHQLRTQ